MKNVYFIFLKLLVFGFVVSNHVYSQMLNGGFEQWDNDDDNDGNPDDYWNYSLEYAVDWHNLVNTCDVGHSSAPFVYGNPNTGVGFARFVAANTSGLDEFCLGKTLPLSAGVTYVVSFWLRLDFPSDRNESVGVIVSETVPLIQTSPFSSSHTPQFITTPQTTQYVKNSFCFTPQNSGQHYITFGPWGTSGGTEAEGFLLDDVEVEVLAPGSILSSTGLTIPQLTYCVGDNIGVDGSSSINETSYTWEVYQLVNSTGEQFLYSSGQLTGQASTFDVSTVINSPEPGDCYRVYLTGYNGCNDVESIDFCYEDPNINFLNGTNYLCEGVPTDLTVTGDNGWTYTWSTGESGLGSDGFKTIQVTPTGTTATYSVNVVTTLGCSVTESITFNVFSSNNLAPWMNGINGSGEYTIYVNQGDIVNFNSNLFNDNTNELVTTFIGANNLPSIFWQILEPTDINGQTLSFQWNTGQGIIPDVSPGIYQFTLVSNDGNQCSNIGPSYFTFTIVVICDQCPMCVYYEDRGLMPQTPLPSETKAGKCIVAGFSQPVSTGGASVLFQAGVSIDLGTFFTAEPGFVAQIDPTTCVMDCEDCCTDWTGFTMDEIPNGYYMNFDDSDPTNDIFQVTDINHPFCAFSAKGYGLSILNQWGNVMAESAFGTSSCCPFESPAPENPVLHSSIWWDGYTENIFGNQVHPHDGTYFYILTLYGCNGEEEVYQGFSYILSSAGKIASPSDNTKMTSEQIASIESINRLMEEISLAPNPASSEIQIIGIEQGKKYKVQLFDDKGIMLEKDLLLKNGQFDVSKLNPGTYFCKIFIDGTLISKKFVKI